MAPSFTFQVQVREYPSEVQGMLPPDGTVGSISKRDDRGLGIGCSGVCTGCELNGSFTFRWFAYETIENFKVKC